MKIPRQYKGSIEELIRICDAYAYDPAYVWPIARLAAIIDTEAGEKGAAFQILLREYCDKHNIKEP